MQQSFIVCNLSLVPLYALIYNNTCIYFNMSIKGNNTNQAINLYVPSAHGGPRTASMCCCRMRSTRAPRLGLLRHSVSTNVTLGTDIQTHSTETSHWGPTYRHTQRKRHIGDRHTDTLNGNVTLGDRHTDTINGNVTHFEYRHTDTLDGNVTLGE